MWNKSPQEGDSVFQKLLYEKYLKHGWPSSDRCLTETGYFIYILANQNLTKMATLAHIFPAFNIFVICINHTYTAPSQLTPTPQPPGAPPLSASPHQHTINIAPWSRSWLHESTCSSAMWSIIMRAVWGCIVCTFLDNACHDALIFTCFLLGHVWKCLSRNVIYGRTYS